MMQGIKWLKYYHILIETLVAWKAPTDQEASNHLAAQLNPDNAKRIDLAHHPTGGVPRACRRGA